ncbi:related to starvation induced protein PSI-7 [Rhynchosporium graminicola]|uniref:triacylglycerol lipase n=1 Tax=Rhynchosporium graminicola TaxID=2792576 RepID=A0A1E1L470_9HELO|nr:related to starvation induced protein PSI-7 [Rhynchosporium commune]
MKLQRKALPKCTSAGRVTAGLLLSFLALSSPITAASEAASQQEQAPIPILPPSLTPDILISRKGEHVFSLRHVFHHGDLNRPALHIRHDVPKTVQHLWIESEEGNLEEVSRPLVVQTSPMKIHRLKDARPSVVDPMVAAARDYSDVWASSPEAWTMDDVEGPDVSSMQTILTFAQMAANAYVEAPGTGDWKDVHGGFNRTNDVGFGWDSDGLRGYLYGNEDNSVVVIGLKGTTLAIWDGDGTTTNDKENDNLFFSCCCGQQGSAFYRQSLKKENRYYAAARSLYSNVTAMYPSSEIWMSGHSLGGSVSAMIGLTYGKPVLTFQSVPDALPANRLGLPVPPGVDPDRPGQREYTGAFHFGQNADPIYMGTCNGATASCSYAGYALESACHTGRECVFDVVNKNGTRVSIITHKIIYVIENVLKKWTKAPECKFTPECYDCPLWKEITGNSSKTSTVASSTTTKTRTRTSTCQTPGWWGCLDETTTTTGTSTSTSTTTTSTSTCKTPGWFGCNDETTTTTSSSIYHPPTITQTSKSTSTATCKTPGWFGCNDPTTTSHSSTRPTSANCQTPGLFWGCDDVTSTRSHTITSPPSMPTSISTAPATTSTHSCTSKEWFGLICIDPSPISSPKPTHKPDKKSHCVRRSFIGFCKEWAGQSINLKEEI